MAEKNIKSMNRKYLLGYILLNWLLFLTLSGLFKGGLQEIEDLLKKTTTLFGFLLIPLSIVFEGVLSSDLKYKIVFWKARNPLPACRAFTKIAPEDPRIDMARLRPLFHGEIPEEPESQNTAWYKLYNNYSSKDCVFDAHKSFLLTRDLAALSLILMPIMVLVYPIWGVVTQKMLIHLGLLVSVLIGASIASQNYGKRFVANVLVEATHDKG